MLCCIVLGAHVRHSSECRRLTGRRSSMCGETFWLEPGVTETQRDRGRPELENYLHPRFGVAERGAGDLDHFIVFCDTME